MSEYAKRFRDAVTYSRRRVRRLRIVRADETRLAEACLILGCDGERYRKRAWRAARDVKLALVREAEMLAAEKDCGGMEFMEAEVARTLFLSRAPRERRYNTDAAGKRQYYYRTKEEKSETGARVRDMEARAMMADRQVRRQRRLTRKAAALPEDPLWREPAVSSEDEAARIVAAEVARLLKRLEDLAEELFACKTFLKRRRCTCEAATGIISERFETVSFRGLAVCHDCRTVIWEADSAKLDLRDLTAGMVDMRRSEGLRRPGRSER